MEIKRTTVRLPKKLYDKLKELARKNERSINAQIVYLLKKAVKDE